MGSSCCETGGCSSRHPDNIREIHDKETRLRICCAQVSQLTLRLPLGLVGSTQMSATQRTLSACSGSAVEVYGVAGHLTASRIAVSNSGQSLPQRCPHSANSGCSVFQARESSCQII